MLDAFSWRGFPGLSRHGVPDAAVSLLVPHRGGAFLLHRQSLCDLGTVTVTPSLKATHWSCKTHREGRTSPRRSQGPVEEVAWGP
jgi:hypothetical protein